MRKTILIVAIVAGIGSGIGYVVYQFLDRNSDSARAYVEDSVSAIATYWQPQMIYDRASDEYKQNHDMQSIINFCSSNGRRFGTIQAIEHPYGSLGGDYRSGIGAILTAEYAMPCDFLGTKGTLMMAVARIKGEWQIDELRMQAGVLPDYESNARERAHAPKRPLEPTAVAAGE